MRYFIVIVALLLFVSHAGAVTLVQDGEPIAVIILGKQPHPVAFEAAIELQRVIKRISGAKLPIYLENEFHNGHEGPRRGILRIYVGDSQTAREAGLDLSDLPPEGFKIMQTSFSPTRSSPVTHPRPPKNTYTAIILAGRDEDAQAWGWRGDRARFVRIDCLVILPVGGDALARSVDIGRQGHHAMAFQRRLNIVTVKPQSDFAGLVLFSDRGTKIVGKDYLVINPELASRAGKGPPVPCASLLVQRDFYPRLSPFAAQPRRDDAGIIDDKHISRPHKGRQVAHCLIGETIAHHQQPRRVARFSRRLRDQIARQIKIEIGGSHVFSLMGPFPITGRAAKAIPLWRPFRYPRPFR